MMRQYRLGRVTDVNFSIYFRYLFANVGKATPIRVQIGHILTLFIPQVSFFWENWWLEYEKNGERSYCVQHLSSLLKNMPPAVALSQGASSFAGERNASGTRNIGLITAVDYSRLIYFSVNTITWSEEESVM
jgi:hypothetical protein